MFLETYNFWMSFSATTRNFFEIAADFDVESVWDEISQIVLWQVFVNYTFFYRGIFLNIGRQNGLIRKDLTERPFFLIERVWKVLASIWLFRMNSCCSRAGVLYLKVSITSSIMIPYVIRDLWSHLTRQNVLRRSLLPLLGKIIFSVRLNLTDHQNLENKF